MQGRSKRFAAIVVFTGLLIAVVNVTWWFAYQRTSDMLEQQLSRRLCSLAATGAATLSPVLIDSLTAGDPESYLDIAFTLEAVKQTDSLAEVFILDDSYRYMVSTQLEHDSLYLLTGINGLYIDSVLYALDPTATASASYQSGDITLKSAFAPLYDSERLLAGVLGVEASVDYFDDLNDLRTTLLYASALSLIGGLALGLVFLGLQRRISRTEQRLFLAETESFLGRMVSVVAHELKNPMMIIRAAAERTQKRLEREQTSLEEPGYIVEEIDRLNQIVSGYLEFSRTGSGLLANDTPEAFKPAELAGSLREHVLRLYPEATIDIREESNNPLSLVGYRRSLRQVLLNLILNAIEAGRAAENELKVTVEMKSTGGKARLAVTDSGPGMSREQQRQVKDPFYTTKQTGSGLGLFISNRLVEEMGGTLTFESKPGRGTRVILELPKEPTG